VNVQYNCSTGTCGDCKVRLLGGEVESTPSDYRFTPQEKAEGQVLLCTSFAQSDLVIAAQEAHSAADIPVQSITAKVAKIEARGENLRILHLRTPRTRTLRFLAGQHVCLHLPQGSIDAAVASCPCNGMQLQFHLRREADEPFVERVFTDLSHGEAVEIQGPYGEVTLDDDSARPLLMVAINEEFAAIKSLIEHAINLDLTQPIRLFWLAGSETGHYLENHCRAWGDVLDDYRYRLLVMDGEEAGEAEWKGLLGAIADSFPDLSRVDAYIAAPLGFQQQLRQRLLAQGAEGSRLFMPSRRALHTERIRHVSDV
jgi:CDP-4-dehydro-6-deoxyglucose reductase